MWDGLPEQAHLLIQLLTSLAQLPLRQSACVRTTKRRFFVSTGLRKALMSRDLISDSSRIGYVHGRPVTYSE
jgi:hypothetical protein